ncbi:hypothetical protein [Sandaracinus amylolyticus]|uniref:hypothetical protein n=1 Tax=Sandaracinus amylolyticus TaxID=927083 RepID=UPI001F1C5BC6|nr:hypothetical protein [Sandaracinus amylolyticus]
MRVRAWWVPGLACALGACLPDVECGALEFNHETRLCQCPMGAPYDADAGGCVLPDGGVIPVDGGMGETDAGSPPQTIDACVARPERCNGIDDDCDGESDESAASAACETVSGSTRRACSAGECVVIECASGTDDCDDEYENGCESVLASDDAHCGSCGAACAPGESCEDSDCVELPVIEWMTPLAAGARSSLVVGLHDAGDSTFCVAGAFTGSFPHGFGFRSAWGDQDLFVARVSHAGALEWLTTLGSEGRDESYGVVAGPEGTCIIIGRVTGARAYVGGALFDVPGADSYFLARIGREGDPAIEWTGTLYVRGPLRIAGSNLRTFGDASAATSVHGTSVAAGSALLTFDASTLRLRRASSTASIGAITDSAAFTVERFTSETRRAGQTFAPGGGADLLVTRWTLDGVDEQAWQVGRGADDAPTIIAVDDGGTIRVGATSQRETTSARDAVVWVLAPGSTTARMDVVSASPTYALVASIFARGGRVWVGGVFTGSLPIGERILSSLGETDTFLSQWNEEGQVLWARAIGTAGPDWAGWSPTNEGLVFAGAFGGELTAAGRTVTPGADGIAAFVLGATVD